MGLYIGFTIHTFALVDTDFDKLLGLASEMQLKNLSTLCDSIDNYITQNYFVKDVQLEQEAVRYNPYPRGNQER